MLSANHVVLFVSIVYLGGLYCFVLYSAICTAQSKTAKVIADMEQEGAVQSPSGAPIAVEMSQVEDFFKSTIDSLTSKLTNKIDEKLQSFKRQIVEEQSSRLDSAVKRFKKDGYFFKKEEKVMGVLVEVKEAVAKSDAVVAVQRIEEGMNLVKTRMKLIKVADRSQYGWSTVKEYEQDDLASDSEDEKRLTRSERQAERKVKALLAKRSRQTSKDCSSFVHELSVFDCATLSGNNKMFAVIKFVCVHFFYFLQCLAFRAEYLFICGMQFSR